MGTDLINHKKDLTGPQRAAVVLLALGDMHGRDVWQQLDEDEIRMMSTEIAGLGNVAHELVEVLLADFHRQVQQSPLRGDIEQTRRLLAQFLPRDVVDDIIDQVGGARGGTMYQKLTNVSPKLLANYLKNEHPQTIAVILSRLNVTHAAKILIEFGNGLSEDVVNRMLFMEEVPREILERIDQTLRADFIAALNRQARRNPVEHVAEVLNVIGKDQESRFLAAIGRQDPDVADRVRANMFSFDTLAELAPIVIHAVLRGQDHDLLARALKGATAEVRRALLANVSKTNRQAILRAMAALPPLRLREVDEAQMAVLAIAREREARGEFDLKRIVEPDEEEMIF